MDSVVRFIKLFLFSFVFSFSFSFVILRRLYTLTSHSYILFENIYFRKIKSQNTSIIMPYKYKFTCSVYFNFVFSLFFVWKCKTKFCLLQYVCKCISCLPVAFFYNFCFFFSSFLVSKCISCLILGHFCVQILVFSSNFYPASHSRLEITNIMHVNNIVDCYYRADNFVWTIFFMSSLFFSVCFLI